MHDAAGRGSGPGQATISSHARRLMRMALGGAVALVAGYHVALHVATVPLAEPMGSWETGYAVIARLWPAQYQVANYPLGHDGYGPGYAAFVQPFSWIGLDVYVAHRVANFAALLGACGLLAWWLHRRGARALALAASVAIVYALNAGSYSVQARPDFLALLAIVGVMLLGEQLARGDVPRVVPPALALGAVTLIGVLTKAYAGVIWIIVIGFGVVFGRRRRALATAAISGVIIAGGVALFSCFNPLYWPQVFHGQVVQATRSFSWLLHQTADFALLTAGLILIAGMALWEWGRGSIRVRGSPDFNRAYWAWLLVLSSGVFLALVGWHEGAYLTYGLHWMLVPLAVIAALEFGRGGTAKTLASEVALLANLAVLMATAPAFPPSDPEWDELRRDILAAPGRVAVDYLMEPIAREKPGVHLLDTGRLGYALQEPFLIRQESAAVIAARKKVRAFVASEVAELFGENPVPVLYLDCLVRPAADASGRSALVPRNGLPYLGGENLAAYEPVRLYRIHPYYFATNLPRSLAGRPTTTIVKFVRRR